MNVTALSFVLIAACVAAEIFHEVAFKVAANKAGDSAHYVRDVARQPWMWFGMLLWAIQTGLWIVVLQSVPLVVAFPLMTLSYAGVPAASALFLRERMSKQQIIGAMLILGGVLCVGATAA